MTGPLPARFVAKVPTSARGPVAAGGASLLALITASALLPNGAPLGIVLLGLTLGGLSALGAMGLVLVYRSSRVVNFAQAEIGGLAATASIIILTGYHLPYIVAVVVGLGVALATGLAVEATVVRRFFNAPRLILTVATIGVAQILAAAEIWVPTRFQHLDSFTTFKGPFRVHFRVGPVLFSGDHVAAIAVAVAVAALLSWFFRRSDTGVAIRAAADSNERAVLLGINVRRLSRISWMLAAGLSGLGAILSAPLVGANVGVAAGPEALLAPLAAAVLGGMESLAWAAAAALGVGVFEQVMFWNYPEASYVDVGLFVIILAGLLLRRRKYRRVSDTGLGSFVAAAEVRPVPAVLRQLPAYRLGTAAVLAPVVVLAGLVPLVLNDSQLTLWSYMAIYGLIAVSLVVLTGWAGQISLGQFAFVGVGAATTAALVVHAHADLFVALFVAAVVGAAGALVIGLPALRLPGLLLAVTTLAFAVPVSTYLLNSTYFPTLNPILFGRPYLFDRFSLASPRLFYYLCLAFLVAAVLIARNFRRTRAGRALLAVRDNERCASAYSIEPLRAKLTAFALAGAIAGLAGGLYAADLRGVPFSGFKPVESLTVFTMVVIGGVASVPGAILGAIYVEGAQWFLPGAGPLLATGAGLLFLLFVAPGGLGEILYRARDGWLRRLAVRHHVDVPSLQGRAAFVDDRGGSLETTVLPTVVPGQGLASLEGIDASYGQVQVLFGVDLDVPEGQIITLLGTNGAGKSTALRVLSGLMRPSSGRVIFDGRDITSLGPIDRVKLGLVTAMGGRGVFPSLTVAEHLRLAGWLYRHDREFLARTRERVFELFPVLGERIDTEASLLSGGEQQMLLIAQALFGKPRLLLIDELSLGLAPALVGSLLDVVRRINEGGTTVVVVEQSVNVATTLARQAVFMERGQVRFTGPTADLLDRPDLLRSVFLRNAAAGSADAGAAVGSDARLEVSGLSRSFGGVRAVRDVGFSVRAGEILGIIGSNGAGKTTLFDMCSGFLPADAGMIRLDGRDVTQMTAAERAELGLGRSFQDARLFPSLTVAETLATALDRHIDVRDPLACMFGVAAAQESENEVGERVEDLLQLLGLERYRDAFVSELSTGTRRIVELGCAMAHRPSVLLLDEPSSGIAQRESEALARVLLDVKERTDASLVIIEHDIPLVSSIANRLICLHLGAVIAEGTPAEVLADPAVMASYLGDNEAAVFRSGSLSGPEGPGAGPGGPVDGEGAWVSTSQYAELAGISVAQARQYARTGRIESIRDGRRYLLRTPINPRRLESRA